MNEDTNHILNSIKFALGVIAVELAALVVAEFIIADQIGLLR